MKKDFWRDIQNYRLLKKINLKLSGGVVHLNPRSNTRGNVLISYITLPFVVSDKLLDAHTNRWECREIANIFLERGYAVDIIDWTNTTFIPRKNYTYFLDIHSNMERIAPLLNEDCIKILHLTTSYWKFQNDAEQGRLLDLKKRRGVSLPPQRNIVPSRATDYANFISLLGNKITEDTYPVPTGKITRIPLSATHTYPSPAQKNFKAARGNFIWFGGSGMIHKGLDLVIEAFVGMPEYHLTICGKVANEKDFVDVYKKELYDTPNITVVGLIDPGSKEFQQICSSSVALIYPSCSEGQSGAVITTMHAGLIPIISEHSGVDVTTFGTTLKKSSVEEIKETVRNIASLPVEELRSKAVSAWQYAREYHTREKFSSAYRAFIDMIEKTKK